MLSNTELSQCEGMIYTASGPLPDGIEQVVKGYDFNAGINYEKILDSYLTTGFQATEFARAVDEVNRMLHCKRQAVPDDKKKEYNSHPTGRECGNCTLYLAYTSNMITSGVRETLRYIAQHNLVDVMITSAGGIEEDFMKCMSDFYIGEFHSHKGADLRLKGINRTGNLFVPNLNYDKFESWIFPILDRLLIEQTNDNINWTPSRLISRLGKEIDDPNSVYYWCYKNNIPVYCPGITDGAIGDALFFHSMRNPGLKMDVIEDIVMLNSLSIQAINSGMIILGGGIIKHHTCNANLMRNGADFSVFINTANEFDGSDAGALPDEAVSWGKIRIQAHPVKVFGEASFVFPLLAAKTFAKFEEK